MLYEKPNYNKTSFTPGLTNNYTALFNFKENLVALSQEDNFGIEIWNLTSLSLVKTFSAHFDLVYQFVGLDTVPSLTSSTSSTTSSSSSTTSTTTSSTSTQQPNLLKQ